MCAEAQTTFSPAWECWLPPLRLCHAGTKPTASEWITGGQFRQTCFYLFSSFCKASANKRKKMAFWQLFQGATNPSESWQHLICLAQDFLVLSWQVAGMRGESAYSNQWSCLFLRSQEKKLVQSTVSIGCVLMDSYYRRDDVLSDIDPASLPFSKSY